MFANILRSNADKHNLECYKKEYDELLSTIQSESNKGKYFYEEEYDNNDKKMLNCFKTELKKLGLEVAIVTNEKNKSLLRIVW